MKQTATFEFDVDYDDAITTPDEIEQSLNILMDTALSSDSMDNLGEIEVGAISEAVSEIRCAREQACPQRHRFWVKLGSDEYGGEIFGPYASAEDAAQAVARLVLEAAKVDANREHPIDRFYRIIEAKTKAAAMGEEA